MYNIDVKSIENSYKKGKTREESKKNHLKQYFELDKEEQIYKIKPKYEHDFRNFYNQRIKVKEEEKILESVFKVKIQIPK